MYVCYCYYGKCYKHNDSVSFSFKSSIDHCKLAFVASNGWRENASCVLNKKWWEDTLKVAVADLSVENWWCPSHYLLSTHGSLMQQRWHFKVCFYVRAKPVVVFTCLLVWCALFTCIRSDVLLRRRKYFGSVDYLWVFLWPTVLPWCQCKKFTVSAVVWILIALFKYTAQKDSEEGKKEETQLGSRKERKQKIKITPYVNKCVVWEGTVYTKTLH